MIEESEAVFYIETKGPNWGGEKRSKVRLLPCEEKIVIENPPGGGRCGFAAKKPLVIPYDLFLAVATKFCDNLQTRRRRIFDASQDIKLSSERNFTSCGDKLVLKYVHKNGNIWSVKSIKLHHESYDMIARWRFKFETILKSVKARQKRPRRLLAFINPYGGKGEAVRLNSAIVQPLFDTCQIDCEVVITERANHARDSLLSRDLEDFDGVICVGGDGMFGEIFNALLAKSAKDNGVDLINMQEASSWLSKHNLTKPSIRVGVIPGGSTDAVAMSVHGTNDVVTATLHIILGDHLDVDVTSVCSGGIFQRFSMAMVSYGYFGDLMRRSEHYRWLGPKRYDVSGVRTFLGNKGYEGTISYVETVRQNTETVHDQCVTDCSTCTDAKEIVETGDEKGYLVAKVLTGKFSVITGACTKCASRFTPRGLSPNAHLGDGLADLILVSKTSRFNYLRYLYRTACLRSSPFDLPFVERVKVREFSFTPDSNGRDQKKTSVWNCDGELLLNPEISVRVHCQILPVFARGPEL